MADRTKNGKMHQTESEIIRQTAHDWEDEHSNNKDFYDDGTMSYFWRAHTITVLVMFTCVLVYVAVFEVPSDDPEYNTKRGITACVLAFLTFSITQTPDGPFKRPHPAFWRVTLCLSIIYELFLIFLLFQTVDDSRMLMKYFDEDLGKPLPEKSYGGNCLLYDADHPQDPFHNIWDKTDLFVPSHLAGWYFKDKMDPFVPCHFFGWWVKTLILRDYWLCTVLSIMFEFMEYTLEHQLPNFSECWWDHWIMDALVCNGLGIFLGMITLRYLSMKPYHWRGIWNCPSYTDKLRRVAAQFTPYSWTDFDWRPTESLRRWLGMLGVITIFLLAELNTFYLKFVLWIPPPHFLCLGRLVLFLCWGAVAMRETFQYMDDPNCKRFGRQSWVIAVIIITELLIILRFDFSTVTKPVPSYVIYCWAIGVFLLTSWTLWNFYLKRHPAWFLFIENTVSSVAHRCSSLLGIGAGHHGDADQTHSNKMNGDSGIQNGATDSAYNTRSKNRRRINAH